MNKPHQEPRFPPTYPHAGARGTRDPQPPGTDESSAFLTELTKENPRPSPPWLSHKACLPARFQRTAPPRLSPTREVAPRSIKEVAVSVSAPTPSPKMQPSGLSTRSLATTALPPPHSNSIPSESHSMSDKLKGWEKAGIPTPGAGPPALTVLAEVRVAPTLTRGAATLPVAVAASMPDAVVVAAAEGVLVATSEADGGADSPERPRFWLSEGVVD
ncbi:unnamed protein product [Linum trigynum]|uniref:Uncharacterized protein n=1 Tax=Linum trigynum TaxID=586398 RepID=A0AAV2EMD3_9ROSI